MADDHDAADHDAADHDGAERAAVEGEKPIPLDARSMGDGTDPRTDLANAERFRALYGSDVRWCSPLGGWLCYARGRWAPNNEQAERWSHDVARRLLREAEHKHAIQWAQSSQDARRLAAMLRTARPLLAESADAFDADPYVFNVANGTIDLRTGELYEHQRADMLTKIATARFDPDAAAPRWLAFLERMQPDAEVRAFLQRAVGYSIFGDVREHVLFLCVGKGANGKGVFLNLLARILGPYASIFDPLMLASSKTADRHPTELVDLRGARMAIGQEGEIGRALNEALVKRLTGGDPITARRMRCDPLTWRPTHKLWLATNHAPRIREKKNAIWRRVLLILWPIILRRDEQDHDLPERLYRDEAAGVLRWCIDGYRLYREHGLSPPAAVRLATERYRDEQDELTRFIGERCAMGPEQRVTRRTLKSAYVAWCEENGEDALTPTALWDALRDVEGVREGKVRGERLYPEDGWLGIGLARRAGPPVYRDPSGDDSDGRALSH
jgi:putative DNA primase/helicase